MLALEESFWKVFPIILCLHLFLGEILVIVNAARMRVGLTA